MAQIPLGSTRLDSTHSTCRAHAFRLCRASRRAQLDSFDTSSSTGSTGSTKSNVSSRAKWNLSLFDTIVMYWTDSTALKTRVFSNTDPTDLMSLDEAWSVNGCAIDDDRCVVRADFFVSDVITAATALLPLSTYTYRPTAHTAAILVLHHGLVLSPNAVYGAA